MDDAVAAELVGLEDEGWGALRAGGGSAIAFFDSVLDSRITMLLPGGIQITSRAAALKSMSGTPWDAFQLTGWAVREVAQGIVLLTYSAAARRGSQDYSALVSSLYVLRPGGWRLAFHQQTPL